MKARYELPPDEMRTAIKRVHESNDACFSVILDPASTRADRATAAHQVKINGRMLERFAQQRVG